MARTGFTDDFKRNFLTGFAALFPILITIFLLSWLYRQIDVSVGKQANAVCREVLVRNPGLFGVVFPGASGAELAGTAARRAYAQQHFPRFVGVLFGLVGAAVLVYLIGGFLRGYIGGRVIRAIDRLFERFPVIKAIYPHARQLGDLLFGQSERRRFRRVVAVEYPRRGVYSVGFLTASGMGRVEERTGKRLVTVFVPTSPTPLTGFVIVLPPDEVIYLDMSVDEAFRYFITAGMSVGERQRPDARSLARAHVGSVEGQAQGESDGSGDGD
jgi:uncharacterized membrane protein